MNQKHIVFVAGEDEYRSEVTLPALAEEVAKTYGARTTVLTAAPDPTNPSNIPGLEALDEADLAVFYMRFRTLPAEQVAHIERYLWAGKPVIGLRTSTHAFRYPEGHPLVDWNDFGKNVLGAPWIYHYGHDSSTEVAVASGVHDDPIVQGLPQNFSVRSWLYQVAPDYPPAEARILLVGTSVGPSPRSVRQSNPVAWTWRHFGGGRVFTTTMGHPEDFDVPAFRRLLVNAMHWALDVPVLTHAS